MAQLLHCHDQEEKANHLSPDANRKLGLMVRSQTKAKKQVQRIRSTGRQAPVSIVKPVLHCHSLRGCHCKTEALALDVTPYNLTEVCCWSHRERKHLQEENCGQMKQKCCCLSKLTSNVWRSEAEALILWTPYLLSGMVVAVLCCGAVLLLVDLLL